MRLFSCLLMLILLLIQWPLWMGQGGWFRVWQLEDALRTQEAYNTKQSEHNQALFAEIQDLKTGTEAIEERARTELGMIQDGEVFFQIPAPARAEEEPP